jgi:hypothetical protein
MLAGVRLFMICLVTCCCSSGHDAYFYQLFMDKDDRVVLPTTQQLLELSCLQSDVKFSEVSDTSLMIGD